MSDKFIYSMRFWPFNRSEQQSIQQANPSSTKCKKVYSIIELPKPKVSGGLPLADALSKRRSLRNFLFERISDQQLSDLLWSACGVNYVNRSDDEVMCLHTNPTACNHQEVLIYVFMHEGVFLYDSVKNHLLQIKTKDYRGLLSKLEIIQKSEISLCLVSDLSKMIRFDDHFRRDLYSPLDVGYVSENIYLYCAANNLATCACGLIDRETIVKILGLSRAKVFLVHPIGKALN